MNNCRHTCRHEAGQDGTTDTNGADICMLKNTGPNTTGRGGTTILESHLPLHFAEKKPSELFRGLLFCRYCTEQPSQYFLPRDLKVKSGWHVRLVFHELIVGPLAVGAGQYVGLVLFARNDA